MTRRTTLTATQMSLMQAMARKTGHSLDNHTMESMIRAYMDWHWNENLKKEMHNGPFGLTEPVDKTVRRILDNDILPGDIEVAMKTVVRRDMYMATKGKDDLALLDDTIYRVSIFPDRVDVLCLGVEKVDSQIDGHYDRPDLLPDWVQERLAILMMMDATPPTTEVEGVGRRISTHVYWVYSPDRRRAEVVLGTP